MHTIWMVELAALWADFGKAIGYTHLKLPLPALNSYWIASRQRADRWNEALFVYRQQLESVGAIERSHVWRQIRRVIEEVLLSEVLTRVMAAIATDLEDGTGDEDASPITSSVYQTHLEARQRCLQLMVDGFGQPVSDAVHLNRLRFQLEEWTDMFLAQLGDRPGPKQHCHRLSRLEDWIEEDLDSDGRPTSQLEQQLRNVGIRRWLSRLKDTEAANPVYNQEICDSVLAMLRPEWFDSLGCFQSLAAHRMQSMIEETDGMVSSLLSPLSQPLDMLQFKESMDRYRNRN